MFEMRRMKKSLLCFPILFCLSCTAKSELKNSDFLVIDEALLDVKNTLPKKNSPYTIWKDIYREGQKIFFIYQMDNYSLPVDKIHVLEEIASSEPVKSQICNSLINDMDQEYIVVSNTYDMNDKLLFSYTYSKKNC